MHQSELVSGLECFVDLLKEYQDTLSERKKRGLTIGSGPNAPTIGGKATQGHDPESLREQLIRESGRFKSVVVELTGSSI